MEEVVLELDVAKGEVSRAYIYTILLSVFYLL
jgi:hypothetical protein